MNNKYEYVVPTWSEMVTVLIAEQIPTGNPCGDCAYRHEFLSNFGWCSVLCEESARSVLADTSCYVSEVSHV